MTLPPLLSIMDTIQLVEVNALEESTENNEMPVVGLLACFL